MALGCPWCGEPAAAGDRCVRCGRALLFDLCLAGAPPVERERFLAARAISGLGAPAPSFVETKELLGRPRATLAAGVSQAFAERAFAALAGSPVKLEALPHRPPPALFRARTVVGLVVSAVLLAGALTALLARAKLPAASLFSSKDENPAAAGGGAAGAPGSSDGQRAAPVDRTKGGAAGSPGTPAEQAASSPADIAARVLAGVVSVRCKETVGAGFFIDEETVLTNAHVACKEGETATVRLHDGRQLLGRTLERDDWIDLARLEVVGGAGRPLPIGDSTAVRPSDPAMLVGSPRGLDFTLHQGRVSFVGRVLQGISYLQVDASINPGNSGGPLLDAAGRVIGVVTLKLLDTDGIGLALPIEYALPPREAAAESRWGKLLAAAKDDDDQQRARIAEETRRPYLFGLVTLDGGGLGALVVQRFEAGPHSELHLFDVREGSSARCSASAAFDSWLSVEEAAKKHERAARGLQWLVRSGANRDLYVGAAALSFADCAPEVAKVQTSLVLKDGAMDRGSARLSSAELAKALERGREDLLQRRAERAQSIASGPPAPAERGAVEQSWRAAFRQAQADIAANEAAVRDARRGLNVGGLELHGPAVAQQRREAQKAQAALDQSKRWLHELERRAALQAVPREWRR